jgi:Putative beta-barrel porin-2, OmpL-like. bbp2
MVLCCASTARGDGSRCYDAMHFSAFADGYAGVNYNFPKPQTGQNHFRAFDVTNGFALAWVGLDASYDPAPVGGTVSLRFGPQATIYGGSNADAGLANVKQAFASWRPVKPLTLDFGKFDTLYGAEVADSQGNYDYTRGVLYWLGQPLFHTGLRATLALSDELALKAIAVNGWNNSLDNNAGKSFGVQLVYSGKVVSASLGWLGGPEQDDTRDVACAADTVFDPATDACAPSPGAPASDHLLDVPDADALKAWRHLVDLVVSANVTERLSVLFNADYGAQGTLTPQATGYATTRQSWYGAMLAARYQLDPVWAVAGRGEYYRDVNGLTSGVPGLALATATLTLEAKPSPHLLLRLDNRADFAVEAASSKDVFAKGVRGSSSRQVTTTLGVVVTTD